MDHPMHPATAVATGTAETAGTADAVADSDLGVELRELRERQIRLRRRIQQKLRDLQEDIAMVDRTAQELNDLLRRADTVDEGLAVLMRSLKAKVDAARGNQDAINAAFDEITNDLAAKAALIVENTPVDPNAPGGAAGAAAAAKAAAAQKKP